MPGVVSQLQHFCNLWAENISSSLTSYGVVAPTVIAADAASTPAPSQQEFEKLVCIRFTCAGAAKGELLWVAEKAPALRIARLLTGAASAAAEPEQLSEEDRDAFAEFLRQAAGQTATSWKAEFSSELTLTFQATAVPAPVTAQCSTFTLVAEQFASLTLRLFLDADLTEALSAIPIVLPPASSETPASPPPTPAAEVVVPAQRSEPLPANLGLVLDVELEATIRFGEREMLLRDIFGLMAGAVVELNQMVSEPAELHVAGRLVARGEVVVVDGNFGLRVTEVAALHERVAAINL
jgi:flagellar motor switch protein FliN/FliY